MAALEIDMPRDGASDSTCARIRCVARGNPAALGVINPA